MTKKFSTKKFASQKFSLAKVVAAAAFYSLFICPASLAHDGEDRVAAAMKAKKEMVLISEKGFSPAEMKLTTLDSSIFFLNRAPDSLLLLEIDWGKRRSHCATTNLKLSEDGILRTVKAIPTDDFALVCFPEAGSYSVTVKGLKNFPQGLKGTIQVSNSSSS